ncbi:MAG: NTPase [Candidatus Thermoplasmatota archaeon]|nr:NTPase [Candidatus Thermoplasmatota archaeon]
MFVTGKPGSGKTSLILKAADELTKKGLKVGGFVTQDIRAGNKRVGFKIKDLATQREGILAHVEQKEGPRVSKYRVNISDLEGIGVKAVEAAKESADWIIIDEIGKMELYSKKFEEVIRETLSSGKNILATVHWDYEHPLILEIKRDYKVYFLGKDNWSETLENILRRIAREARACGS